MKFSCIVATLNSSRFLARTLGSVLSQTYGGYEIIVQDGGSTDATPEILSRFAKRVNLRSERDSGIYDAWNRALERASGDWAVFLGADDFLIDDGVLERSRECLAVLPASVDFAYGSLALGKDGRPKTKIVNSLASMYSKFFVGIGLPFPATFVRMETLKRYGFDPSYRIAGDFAFTARCLTGDNLARLPHYVAFMEHGGISDNPAHASVMHEERSRVLREHIIPKASLIAGCCLKYLDEKDAAFE